MKFLFSLFLCLFIITPKSKAAVCHAILFRFAESYLSLSIPSEFELQSIGRASFVLSVDGKNRFAVRFETYPHELANEAFASRVLSLAPKIKSPRIRFLNSAEYSLVAKNLPADERYILKGSTRASISEWIDGVSGIDLFHQMVADPENGTALRDFVKPDGALKRSHIFGYNGLQFSKKNEFVALLASQVSRTHPELFDLLDQAWILNSIIGIPDFHPLNWRLDLQGQLVVIDFAHGLTYTGDPASPIPNGLHPYYPGSPPQSFYSETIDRLSAEFLDFLASLNKETLHELARQTDAQINDDVIMANISYVLKRRNWPPNN